MNARSLCVLACITASARAGAQQPPRVRPLGPIVAQTTEPMDRISGLHALSDGRVIVNDGLGRRVLLFDSTLTHFTILLDTTGATARQYPGGHSFPGTIIPFIGDSTVFYDPVAIALVVLDPAGRVSRVFAPPFPPDAGYLIFAGARFDPAQRLLYRASISPRNRPSGIGYSPINGDSAPIVRAASGTSAPDTLAYVKMPKFPPSELYTTKEGANVHRSVIDPFTLLDEWTILADGTVAIIRGQDYHIDWVSPDGLRTSSPKLPFQWHRLSDSEKVVIIDSVTQYAEAHPGRYSASSNGVSVSGVMPAGVIPVTDLADYRPPFARGAMLADADGNVWLLPTPETPLSPNPGPVYDVVNRAGQLVDRVQLSPGFGIIGFAPGYVFMTIREGTTTVVAKARIH
ncbi:MAG TPA: hypothetical protein VMH39_06680 [Gemmatimonadaceae bacterium]|nr:hypothetical protein [Gemmatimonadaceae bacterium]